MWITKPRPCPVCGSEAYVAARTKENKITGVTVICSFMPEHNQQEMQKNGLRAIQAWDSGVTETLGTKGTRGVYFNNGYEAARKEVDKIVTAFYNNLSQEENMYIDLVEGLVDCLRKWYEEEGE